MMPTAIIGAFADVLGILMLSFVSFLVETWAVFPSYAVWPMWPYLKMQAEALAWILLNLISIMEPDSAPAAKAVT